MIEVKYVICNGHNRFLALTQTSSDGVDVADYGEIEYATFFKKEIAEEHVKILRGEVKTEWDYFFFNEHLDVQQLRVVKVTMQIEMD